MQAAVCLQENKESLQWLLQTEQTDCLWIVYYSVPV